jgi:cell division protein FtsB
VKLPQTKITFLVFGVLYLAIIAVLAFYPGGYVKMHRLQKDLDRLNFQIDSLRMENEVLRLTNDSLSRGELNKINRTAREKYDMHKPNEVVIKVEEK